MFGHPYFQREISLATKHEKLKLVKPAFDKYVDCKLFEANVDTDVLGTFTGEIERTHPPLETAVKKARLGMKISGSRIGIASEGSVSPDRNIPFLNSNVEWLVLVDDEREIVISKAYRSFDICAATIKALPGEDLTPFLKKADFPNHALIVRPESGSAPESIKGIRDIDVLSQAIKKISSTSQSGYVVIESDLRAMCSPSRQRNIEKAAELLALRVSQLCPGCGAPGWGCVEYERGVRCSACGTLNEPALRQEKLGCVACEYVELGKVLAEDIDPANCINCNP